MCIYIPANSGYPNNWKLLWVLSTPPLPQHNTCIFPLKHFRLQILESLWTEHQLLLIEKKIVFEDKLYLFVFFKWNFSALSSYTKGSHASYQTLCPSGGKDTEPLVLLCTLCGSLLVELCGQGHCGQSWKQRLMAVLLWNSQEWGRYDAEPGIPRELPKVFDLVNTFYSLAILPAV